MLPVPACVLHEHQRGHLSSDCSNGGSGAAAQVGNPEGAHFPGCTSSLIWPAHLICMLFYTFLLDVTADYSDINLYN